MTHSAASHSLLLPARRFSACWLEALCLFTCHGQYGSMTAFVADENIMASVPCNQFTALWTQSPPENLINSHNVSKCCIVHLERWFSWQMWKIRVARQLPGDQTCVEARESMLLERRSALTYAESLCSWLALCLCSSDGWDHLTRHLGGSTHLQWGCTLGSVTVCDLQSGQRQEQRWWRQKNQWLGLTARLR